MNQSTATLTAMADRTQGERASCLKRLPGPRPCRLFLAGLVCLAAALTGLAGERHALLVGINAYDGSPLGGCVTDARETQRLLCGQLGFPQANLRVLLDREATRDRILGELGAAMERVRSGDLFAFVYSGHGTLFPDDYSEDRDETQITKPPARMELGPGRYDSAICPVDCRAGTSGKPWGNLILDDELYALFSGFTARGCKVVLISDSCLSGSLARDGLRVRGLKLADALGRQTGRTNQPFAYLDKPARSRSLRRTRDDFGGKYLALTSSRDDQFSLDWPAGYGLFNHHLLESIRECLSAGQPVTIRQAFQPTRERVVLLSGNRQEPQLDLRFYRGSEGDGLFETPVPPPAPPPAPLPDQPPAPTQGPAAESAPVRLALRVTGPSGLPVPGAAWCVFRAGFAPAQGTPVSAGEMLAHGFTDAQGFAVFNPAAGTPEESRLSEPMSQGAYWIKVVHADYQASLQQWPVMPSQRRPGVAIVAVTLSPEP